MSKSPIFIHSLFRSGSTYLFKVFRRSALGYWCYQEALHELAAFSRENPSALQQDHGEEKAKLLRHPEIDGAYFKELQETWSAWKDVISESIIYDAYFPGEDENIGIPYWQALAEAARGRPVFQECRTSGRIGAIKRRMGGYHIYLWRNPWDQWWSYKVTPYFDVVNQIILHAKHAPQPVQLLLDALHLPNYEGGDLAGAFAFYGARPLNSEQSYLAFYMLWCLALYEGVQHADMLLDIDRLSDSPDYRKEILLQLKDAGIDGIDFSDCRVPQGRYLKQEQDLFTSLEKRVHQWLIEGGWTQEKLGQIQKLRQQYAPLSWQVPIKNIARTGLVEQARRARALACRFETSFAQAATRAAEAEARASQAEAQALEANERATQAEAQAAQAESRAAEAEARAAQAEARAAEAEARASQAEAKAAEARQQLQQALTVAQQAQAIATQAEARAAQLSEQLHQWVSLAEQREQQLAAMYSSWSWRITAPARFGYDLVLASWRLASKLGKLPILPLLFAMRWVLRDPVLVERLNRKILRFPWLHRPLRALAIRHGLMTVQAVAPMPSPQQTETSVDLSQLTPRARQIYADLKAALAKQQ